MLARRRLGPDVKVQENMDPGVLFGADEVIRDRIIDTVKKAGPTGHILNLGHGILPGTPEENGAYFFKIGKQVNDLISATV